MKLVFVLLLLAVGINIVHMLCLSQAHQAMWGSGEDLVLSDRLPEHVYHSTRDESCNYPVTGAQPKTPDLLS